MIPTLEYKIENGSITHRYIDIVDGFDMPIKISIEGTEKWLFPSAEWKTEKLKGSEVVFDKNFYIETKKM